MRQLRRVVEEVLGNRAFYSRWERALVGPMQPDRRFFFHFCILFLVRPILRPSIRMHRFHPNAYRTFFPKQTTEMPVSCVPTDAVYFGIEVNRAVDQESKRHSGNGIPGERK